MRQRHDGGWRRGALGALLCLTMILGNVGVGRADDGDDASRRPQIRVRLVGPGASDEAPDPASPRARIAADGSFVIPIRRPGTTADAPTSRRPISIRIDGAAPASDGEVDLAPPARGTDASARGTDAPAAEAERGSGASLFERLVGPGGSGSGGDDLLESRRGAAAGDDTTVRVDHARRPAAGPPASTGPGIGSTDRRPATRTAAPAVSQGAAPGRPQAVADGRTYRLGPGDTVDVFVWRDPDLSRQVPVRPDGLISLPLVGEVRASGRTPAELESVITEALSEYVQMPSVTVTVTQIRSLVVYVVGNVGKPGPQTLDREINVLQAIAMAGGLNEFADEDDIVVVRTLADGSEERFPFDYSDVVDGSRPELNIRLRSGDIVYVP